MRTGPKDDATKGKCPHCFATLTPSFRQLLMFSCSTRWAIPVYCRQCSNWVDAYDAPFGFVWIFVGLAFSYVLAGLDLSFLALSEMTQGVFVLIAGLGSGFVLAFRSPLKNARYQKQERYLGELEKQIIEDPREFQRLVESSQDRHGEVIQTFEINGKTYNSLEEMPEYLRKFFQSFDKSAS